MSKIDYKKILSIEWMKVIHRLAFIFVATVMVVSTWYVLKATNNRMASKEVVSREKVLIDVCISDTLTRGMDDKLNIVLQDLLRMKQDSLAVEVRKVQNKH